jgi:hypothetical protein
MECSEEIAAPNTEPSDNPPFPSALPHRNGIGIYGFLVR